MIPKKNKKQQKNKEKNKNKKTEVFKSTSRSQSILEWTYLVYIVFLKYSVDHYGFSFNWKWLFLKLTVLESKTKSEPVEKLITEKKVLLLWCAWFAEIKCIFSVSTDYCI